MLDTKQFCISFDTYINCYNLLLNLSIIISETVTSFVSNQAYTLQQLEEILKEVTPTNIQDCLIFGLVLILVVATIFVSSLFGQVFCLASFLLRLDTLTRMTICLISGLACCILFLVPTIALYTAQLEMQKLRSSIEIEKGSVSSYCLGALCCTIVMMLLATIAPFFT